MFKERHSHRGNKKVGRLSSSDFGTLVKPAKLYRSTIKLRLGRKTVKPDPRAESRRAKGPERLKIFAFQGRLFQAQHMTQPLALVLYEKLLPGSQLVNRLQDLKYRVQTLSDPEQLVPVAEEAKPMLVLADLEPGRATICAAISRLKQGAATNHLPVIAFAADDGTELQRAAQAAGVTLVVGEAALLAHLPELLEQALQVE
jgi:CheY-like chemotaxis protein